MINYFHSQSRRHHSYNCNQDHHKQSSIIPPISIQQHLPHVCHHLGHMFFFIFLLFVFVSTNQFKFIFVIILVNCVYSVKGGGVPIQMKDSDPRLPENNLDITNIHVFL